MSTVEPIHIERIVIEPEYSLMADLASSGLPSLIGIALAVGLVVLLVRREERKKETND